MITVTSVALCLAAVGGLLLVVLMVRRFFQKPTYSLRTLSDLSAPIDRTPIDDPKEPH